MRALWLHCVLRFWCCVHAWRCSGKLGLFTCGRALSRFRSDMSFCVRAFFALAVCGVPAVSKHTRVDVHLEAAPRGALWSGGAGVAGVSSVGFLSAGSSSGGGSGFDRETQAPMVWLNLHKSGAHVSDTSSSFGAYAAQRLADLKQR